MVAFTLMAGFTHVLGKYATDALPTTFIVEARLTIAIIILAPILKAKGLPLFVDRKELPVFSGLALLGIALNIQLFLAGLKYTLPAHAGLLYAMTPLWVLLIARMLKIERITPRKVLGIALAIGGVVLIFGGAVWQSTFSFVKGDTLIMLGVWSWAAYTAFSKPYLHRYSPLTATFTVTALAWCFLLLPAWFQATSIGWSTVPTSAWVGVVYMGVFTSALSYLIYYAVLKIISPSQVAIFLTGQAPTTAFLSKVIQGYAITPGFAIGGVITIAGIILLQITPSSNSLETANGFGKKSLGR